MAEADGLIVTARVACSGELLTEVRSQPGVTIATLRDAIAAAANEKCAMWLLSAGRLLRDAEVLGEAAARGDDGRALIDIVRCEPQPLLAPPPAAPSNLSLHARCALTGEQLGEIRLWPLDNVAALRQHVARLFPDQAEGPLQLLAGETCLAGPMSLASAGVRDGCSIGVIRCEPRRLLTASADGTVRVWDEKGTHIASLPQGEWATSLDFQASSQLLAVGLFDCTVRVWELNTLSCRLRLRGHEGPVLSVAFSGGPVLATASNDRSVRLWHLQDGSCLRNLQGHTDGINSVCFGPTAETLLTASVDRTAKLWSSNEGAVLRSFEGHKGEVTCARFSPPQGNLIATSSADHEIRIWETASGSLVRVLSGFAVSVCCIAFAPSGDLLAATGADGQARLWNIQTGEALLCVGGHQDVATGVAFAADGQCIATCSSDGTAVLWNIESGCREATLEGHSEAVMAATFVCKSDLAPTPTKLCNYNRRGCNCRNCNGNGSVAAH